MLIDTSKTALENLVALIKDANPSSKVSTSNITLGAATARTPDANPRNTSVVITAGTGYQAGTKTLTYNRIGLDKGVVSPDLTIDVAGNDSAAETTLLAELATQLGLKAGEFALDASTPLSGVSNDGTPVNLTLKANDASYFYVGSITIEVTWPVVNPTLDQDMTTADLNGFDAAS